MAFECPPGDGSHPITLVAIAADDLTASATFYSKLFGWTLQSLSPEITAAMAPAGPAIALRANVPDGFQGVVPFLAVPGIASTLQHVSAAGGSTEREPWSVPMVGTLARFRDASGTIYGVSEALTPVPVPHMGMPFGDNPKPPAGAICSLEMYAKEGDAAAQFFGGIFGWGTNATMPQFMAFDPGAGIGGVFQSHTPSLPALAYIYSQNVEQALDDLEQLGGTRLGAAMRAPGMGCFGYFRDPSGTSMGLIGP